MSQGARTGEQMECETRVMSLQAWNSCIDKAEWADTGLQYRHHSPVHHFPGHLHFTSTLKQRCRNISSQFAQWNESVTHNSMHVEQNNEHAFRVRTKWPGSHLARRRWALPLKRLWLCFYNISKVYAAVLPNLKQNLLHILYSEVCHFQMEWRLVKA